MNIISKYKNYAFLILLILAVVFYFLWRLDHNKKLELEKDITVLQATIQSKEKEKNKSTEIEKISSDFPKPKLKVYNKDLPKKFETGVPW